MSGLLNVTYFNSDGILFSVDECGDRVDDSSIRINNEFIEPITGSERILDFAIIRPIIIDRFDLNNAN